jgi:hypothetical protein
MAPSFAPKLALRQRGNSKFPAKHPDRDLAWRNPQKQRLNVPFGFGVYTYDIQWDQQGGERGGDVCFAAAQREGERD